MQQTWKPLAAGVLMIIAGAFFGIARAQQQAQSTSPWWFWPFPLASYEDPRLIAAGVIAIVAGVFALQRKLWPLALAGAVLSFPCNGLFGLLALIWTAQSRREFTGYQISIRPPKQPC